MPSRFLAVAFKSKLFVVSGASRLVGKTSERSFNSLTFGLSRSRNVNLASPLEKTTSSSISYFSANCALEALSFSDSLIDLELPLKLDLL